MKLYTTRGDQGETRLLSGENVPKDDSRIKAYGALDEFQSFLGLVRSMTEQESVKSIIYIIQEDIFVASAELASTREKLSRLKRRIGKEDTEQLESWIDAQSAVYGMPNHFIVPGKTPDSAAMHVARAVCRRCERLIVFLNRTTGEYEELIIFFNRLSDLLFSLAWSLELIATVEDAVRDVLRQKMIPGKLV